MRWRAARQQTTAQGEDRASRGPGMEAGMRDHLQDVQHVVDAGDGLIRALCLPPRRGFECALPTDGLRGVGTVDGRQCLRRRPVRRRVAAAAFR